MSILKGLTTMVLTADDVDAAAEWYADFLGQSPYFRQPPEGPAAYVEFRIGPDEDELGIMDRSYSPEGTTAGAARSRIGMSTMWRRPSPTWWAAARRCTRRLPRVDRSS